VDLDGYKITRKREVGSGEPFEVLTPNGGLKEDYRPLDEEGLWLRFAQNCHTVDDALLFTQYFGLLERGPDQRITRILDTAQALRGIWDALEAHQQLTAVRLFTEAGLPVMREAIFWYPPVQPKRFLYRLIPVTLRDALLHQAGEAITGSRRFRRCRNEGCPNWFRLGPSITDGGRQTITERREFCSDRCRVSANRKEKRKVKADA
jgi:hypothetical protein